MSDSELMAQDAHETFGGKSLQSLTRPRYKSWRKKYRKMRITFDAALEDNKRLFREEQKLENLSRRLREELDGLLDLCLDLNQSSAIPPELRFGLSKKYAPITPEDASRHLAEFPERQKTEELLPIDYWKLRQQLEQQLAAHGVESLENLEASVPHPVPASPTDLLEDLKGDTHSSYLTLEHGNGYLARAEAKVDHNMPSLTRKEAAKENVESWADYKRRETERQAEVMNPNSQHNWLKSHGKGSLPDLEDAESLASHESKPARKRGTKNLAKQVGDRAVERAREELSPGAASGLEEDEPAYPVESFGTSTSHSKRKARDTEGSQRSKGGRGGNKVAIEDNWPYLEDPFGLALMPPTTSKRKGKDPDGTYRSKAGKGGNKGGKRKRTSGEETGNGTASNAGSHKKAKLQPDGAY